MIKLEDENSVLIESEKNKYLFGLYYLLVGVYIGTSIILIFDGIGLNIGIKNKNDTQCISKCFFQLTMPMWLIFCGAFDYTFLLPIVAYISVLVYARLNPHRIQMEKLYSEPIAIIILAIYFSVTVLVIASGILELICMNDMCVSTELVSIMIGIIVVKIVTLFYFCGSLCLPMINSAGSNSDPNIDCEHTISTHTPTHHHHLINIVNYKKLTDLSY